MTIEPDLLDHAATTTQEAAERRIKEISAEAAKIDTKNPSGECWFCGEPTGHDRRWCDRQCSDDWGTENDLGY